MIILNTWKGVKKVWFCTKEIKMRIVIAKEEFNRKISLLTSKLNIELWKILVNVMFGALLYMAQRSGHTQMERKYLESIKVWC